MADNKQFRPYFSESQLLRLIEILQKHSETIEDKNILSYLETFKFKIARGIKKEVYTLQPKQSITEKLGLASVSTVEERNNEVSRLASELDKNREIMSSKEIFDSYFAKLGAGDTLTEEENNEASAIELELYKVNCFFFKSEAN
jgi:hypothetical protein